MKGSQKVIEQLQLLLESELSAFDQYFIHARMYADWGLSALDERITHEAEEGAVEPKAGEGNKK